MEDSTKNKCEWCAKGDAPMMLDSDGVKCSISGNSGRLSHAYDDMWWDCPNATNGDEEYLSAVRDLKESRPQMFEAARKFLFSHLVFDYLKKCSNEEAMTALQNILADFATQEIAEFCGIDLFGEEKKISN